MKLTPKIKALMHIGGFLLLALICYLAIVLPAQKNLGKAEQELAQARRDRTAAEQSIVLLTNQLGIMPPIPAGALTSAQMDTFLRDLSARGRMTGASVERIRRFPRSEMDIKRSGIIYPEKFEIGLFGDFPSLYRMLMMLEGYHKLMTTDGLRFDVDREWGTKMRVTAKATVYVLDVGRRTLTRPGPPRTVP